MKDRIIDAYLKDFIQQFGLEGVDEASAFEDLVNYCVVSKHYPDTFEPEDISVGGDGDLGVDGVALLVNDHLVLGPTDVDFFKNAFRRLDVEFLFIQSKTSPHFEAADIGTFLSGVREFFSSKLSTTANEAIRELHVIKEHIFDSSIDMDRSPSCKLYYVTTGTWKNEPALVDRIKQGTDDLSASGLFSTVEFIPLDAEGLKRLHRDVHHKITREILFEKHSILPQITGVQEAYIGIVPCLEYLKLICDDEGTLNRRLFYDNVRDFQGHNSVNSEIETTVQDSERNNRFVLLNNGITIVARDANKVGATFRLKDYQVVNGCQTSHILHLNKKFLSDKVYLPLKLIVTDDVETTNQIIQGTNRQTEVHLEAFESLAPFQKKLEEFYLAAGRDRKEPLYYERRSKQYDHLGIRRNRIITLATQVKCFVAMFLDEPHSTHRYYGELFSSYRGRVFSDAHSLMPYFLSGTALAVIEQLFADNRLSRVWKPYKYQILMVFRIQNEPFELPFLNSKSIDKYCDALLSILDSNTGAEAAFNRAGELIMKTTRSLPRGREPHARTKVFTTAIIKEAGKVSRPATSELTKGQVKKFSDILGYGFIIGDDGKDYFVHYSDVIATGYRSLTHGQRVQFTSCQTAKGLQATAVEIQSVT